MKYLRCFVYCFLCVILMASRDTFGGCFFFRSTVSPSESFEFLDFKSNSVPVNFITIQVDDKAALKCSAKAGKDYLASKNETFGFDSAKILFENKKYHQLGKKSLLKMIKNPNRLDYEAVMKYARDYSDETLSNAAERALQKIFGETVGDFLKKSCEYFKLHDDSFLQREAFENLNWLVLDSRNWVNPRMQAASLKAAEVLKEHGALPEGHFWESKLEAPSKEQEMEDPLKTSRDSGYCSPSEKANSVQHPSSPAEDEKARIRKLVTEWVIKKMKKERSYSIEEIKALEQENSFSKIALQKTEKELFFAEAAYEKLKKELELVNEEEPLQFLHLNKVGNDLLSREEEAELLDSLRQPVHVYNGDVDRDVRL